MKTLYVCFNASLDALDSRALHQAGFKHYIIFFQTRTFFLKKSLSVFEDAFTKSLTKFYYRYKLIFFFKYGNNILKSEHNEGANWDLCKK